MPFNEVYINVLEFVLCNFQGRGGFARALIIHAQTDIIRGSADEIINISFM